MGKIKERMLANQEVLDCLNDVYLSVDTFGTYNPRKLRSCKAEIRSTEGYILLYSYGTLVAAYAPETDTVYDFLRYVYGYTATSAQHITKFTAAMHASHLMRYYPL